jgi:DNA repair protein RecN (Recombination protein N)
VARDRQVLCVTHLPQVAAFADAHLKVEKRVQGGRTATAVTPLTAAGECQAEVARMLAGLTVTPSALAHAGALLEAARGGAAAPAPARRGAGLRRIASR